MFFRVHWWLSLALLAGCAAPNIERPALTAQTGAARYEARSLNDPGLRQFLQANLGHVPDAWDFDALCWVGFYYQPSLELARAQWATARAAEQTAAQRPNPSLTLTPGYDFTPTPSETPWMPSVGLDYPLVTAGKGERQQEVAGAGAEAARLAIVSAAWQLRSDLRKALNDATAAARRSDALRAEAGVQQQLLSLLEQRFQAGGASAADVATTRTALLRAQAAAADAQTQQATARARVAMTLGLPAAALRGVALPTPPAPPPLKADQLAAARRTALQTRADVLAALANYRGAQAALELELAKRYPDIHLGPSYQYDQGLNKWSLGITFELPVFNHNEGPIAEAVGRRAEAVARFNAVQNQVVGAIDTAEAALGAASAQLSRARQVQDEVQRQVALANQRQQLGAADQVEVQTARLDAATAEAALADAQNAAAAAAGELEDALQIPFANLPALIESARTVSSP